MIKDPLYLLYQIYIEQAPRLLQIQWAYNAARTDSVSARAASTKYSRHTVQLVAIALNDQTSRLRKCGTHYPQFLWTSMCKSLFSYSKLTKK
jgi:hypothetical protein